MCRRGGRETEPEDPDERGGVGRGAAGERWGARGAGGARVCLRRELCPSDVSLWLRRLLTCALELKLPESEPYFQN